MMNKSGQGGIADTLTRKNVCSNHFYVRKNVKCIMERLVLQRFKEWKERKDRSMLISLQVIH